MERIIRSLAFVALVALALSAPTVVLATPAHDASASTAAVSAPTDLGVAPANDPYLGGDLSSQVPTATNCNNFGQCDGIAPGTPCDTPIGCVCGYSHAKYLCGRF